MAHISRACGLDSKKEYGKTLGIEYVARLGRLKRDSDWSSAMSNHVSIIDSLFALIHDLFCSAVTLYYCLSTHSETLSYYHRQLMG
jgi:hypothetical protein